MSSTVLAILAVAWPPIAAWIVLKLFPATITRFIEKEIDRRSDAKLERLKAELEGAYSTLKTSVDVLNASNSGMHPHIIQAVSILWAKMMEMRESFGGLVSFDMISLKEEAQEGFSEGKHQKLLEFVARFGDEADNNVLMFKFSGSELERLRLFCGDNLWLLFFIYRAIIMRDALLIQLSFKEKTFKDWRDDGGIAQLLSSVFNQGDVKSILETKFAGLASALDRLEAKFLHEATRVMSGSKAMSDSLGDMQAMMQLHNAQVAQTLGKRG